VKIGAEGKEVYVYRGDVANTAIKMAGSELNLFTEKTAIALEQTWRISPTLS